MFTEDLYGVNGARIYLHKQINDTVASIIILMYLCGESSEIPPHHLLDSF